MDEKELEKIADRERERAEEEFARMQKELRAKHEQLGVQQRALTEKAMNENLDEHSAKRSTVWIFAILTVILIGSYFSLIVYKPKANYQKAAEYLQNGRYDDAKVIYTKLGDYEDSVELRKECDYLKGCAMLDEERYNQALSAFANVKGYRDRDAIVSALAGGFIQSLDTGKVHSVFVRSVGTVKAVGENVNNCCNVENWRNIKSIACGSDFTVGLVENGSVIATNTAVDWNDIKQITAGDSFFAGLDGSGKVHFYGAEAEMENIKAISACGNNFAAINNDGGVVVSGSAVDNAVWKDIEEISVTDTDVYGLKKDGTIVSTNGRLSELQNVRCIFAVMNTIIAMDNDNKIFAEGEQNAGAFKDMLMVAGNGEHALVLRDDGYVNFLGKNENGCGNVSDWSDVKLVLK